MTSAKGAWTALVYFFCAFLQPVFRYKNVLGVGVSCTPVIVLMLQLHLASASLSYAPSVLQKEQHQQNPTQGC